MLGRKATEQAMKSQEVDLSRLKGFQLCFPPKMRSGVTCNWCLRLHLEVNGMAKESVPLQSTKIIECVCVFLRRSKEQICFLCTKVIMKKDLKQKLTKAYLNLELITEKEIYLVPKVHF